MEGMTPAPAIVTALLAVGTFLLLLAGPTRAQTVAPKPVFRAGVDIVRVAAIVEDRNGRPVAGLSESDFELFDGGERRPIVEFRAGATPISLAVLVDGSGSMAVGPKQERARDFVRHVLSWIEPGRDAVALLAFDSALSVLQPFTTSAPDVARHLEDLGAFGETSLYDAIALTTREVGAHRRPRLALVVITDGADTSSRLDAATVAWMASGSDVPVYVVTVERPRDVPGNGGGDTPAKPPSASLDDLARWTGGRLLEGHRPSSASLAARSIVAELRHQYLIGFESGSRTGWHSLSIRTRQKGLTVRARLGYVLGGQNGKP